MLENLQRHRYLFFRWMLKEILKRGTMEVARILMMKAVLEVQSKMEEMWKEEREKMDQFSKPKDSCLKMIQR